MQNAIRSLAAIAIIGAGFALTPSQASAYDGSRRHGCWFYDGNAPACDICADNCNPYQKCCFIIPW